MKREGKPAKEIWQRKFGKGNPERRIRQRKAGANQIRIKQKTAACFAPRAAADVVSSFHRLKNALGARRFAAAPFFVYNGTMMEKAVQKMKKGVQKRKTDGEKRLGAARFLAHAAGLLLGSCILAFGMYNVHSRCAVTEGGVLGLTLLLKHWFGISPSVSGFIMDATCYLVGWRVLGGDFLKDALIASAGFSLFYRLFEAIGPLLPSLRAYPLAAAVVGALLVGVGVGIVVRGGGAAGGDDALALVISKTFRCNISVAYLATDVTVLALSLSYIPFQRIFFSLITVTLSSFLIGRIQTLRLPARGERGKRARTNEGKRGEEV